MDLETVTPILSLFVTKRGILSLQSILNRNPEKVQNELKRAEGKKNTLQNPLENRNHAFSIDFSSAIGTSFCTDGSVCAAGSGGIRLVRGVTILAGRLSE